MYEIRLGWIWIYGRISDSTANQMPDLDNLLDTGYLLISQNIEND